MNKTRLYVAIMASLPFAAFSLGMGDMTVESALNQPFKAEIQLFDVDIPLAGIKARLASVEDFARIGLDRNEILTLLHFEIKKNEHGQPVIFISSHERIVEPFLEIVVDLTWSNGQLYRAYTVLLDPPGYQLNGGIKATGSPVKLKTYNEPGVVEKPSYAHVVEQGAESGKVRKEATYGPTVANESIWQIAQRYTTPDTTIQQVILAIVGTNSQAFTQGNLNGLKTGERLRIPSSDEVKKVPEDLARGEVDAHDVAWRNKEEIKHVLLPPYIDGVAGTSQFDNPSSAKPITNPATGASPSSIPQAPVFNQQKTTQGNAFTDIFSTSDSLMSAEDSKKPVAADKQPVKPDSAMKAEMDVTNAAIDSMRLVNSQLKNQLQSLEKNNKALQEQMSKRDEDIKQLREQIALLLKQRQAIAAQTSQMQAEEDSSNLWIYVLLLLAAGGLGAFTWLFLKQKANRRNSLAEPDDHPDNETPPSPVKPLLQAQAIKSERSEDTQSAADPAEALNDEAKPTIEKPRSKSKDALIIHQAAIEPAAASVEMTERLPTDEPAAVSDLDEKRPDINERAEPVIESPAVVEELVQPQPPMAVHENEQPLSYEVTEEPAAVADDAEKAPEKKEFKRPLSDLLKTTSDYPVEVVGIDSQVHEAIQPVTPDEEPAPIQEDASESDNFVLDFEPSLEKMVEENKQKHTVSEEVEQVADDGLEFIPTPIETKTEEKAALPEVEASDDQALDFEAGLHYEPARLEPEKAEDQPIESPEIDELLKSDGEANEEGPVIEFDALAEEEKTADVSAAPLNPEAEQKPGKSTKARQEDDKEFDALVQGSTAKDDEPFPIEDERDNEFNFEAEFNGDDAAADIPLQADELADELEETEAPQKLVKSKKALDTLMALAKTYLSMDDHEAAKQSLQEIVEFGNKKQRAEAQKLLDEMDKK
ncbi:FimV/HubP family polar landmark protein [Legionella taurinensis]|nr:FimV/HubP family polar landmark protein [Legionella taurinensis]STY26492.1 FimV protein [Legionella taurinensis]